VLAIAFARFQQRSFSLPTHNPPQAFDTEGWFSGVKRLRDEFNAIRSAIFSGCDLSSHHRAARLMDEAVAALARDGVNDDAAATAVGDAARWLGEVGTSWAVNTPRPWNYGVYDPSNSEAPDVTRSREKRFEDEIHLRGQYLLLRRRLLFTLARTGAVVPVEIDRRAALTSHGWPAEGSDPITQDELLAWVRETEQADTNGSGPPADDKPDGLFAGLRVAADKLRLKGNEQTIVAELCKRNGRVPLADLSAQCEWAAPYEDTWNAAHGRLNKKLKKHGWRLRTHDRGRTPQVERTKVVRGSALRVRETCARPQP
jgi:hypothetical protein